MLVLEAIIAAVLVVCVAGGLLFVLARDRVGKPVNMDAEKFWWSLVGVALTGVGIAWITSAIG
jgi:uncharacterized membrane protein YdcZ (DUF606 family)